ncbi:hypothetical protein BO221_04885 [Archangium sp. Cb G35]|uniref:hypothetical protein n=1 Tax=Archangium sp. Cb G35 TaxID=1920190 RepID=UPI0009368FB8|nr:hypothetical protein [Archangium sp. Cb G35]OJT27322.1 hypothetical protein BO221_04885 [Archangium sp. Cb G35]
MNPRNRVGPYTVKKGYRGLGEGSGRVYEAVHAETGTPAVVVAPGPQEDWMPDAEWTVRATAATNPPHLVLEVERAPDGAELPELTLMLHRLAGAASRLEGRPDAAAHLASGPSHPEGPAARRRPCRRRVRWLLMSGTLAAVVAVLLWPSPLPPPPPQEPFTLVDAAPVLLEAVPELLDEGVMTDGAEMGEAAVIGRGVPPKPFKNQKVPPCDPTIEVERSGGCWMPHAAKPPCPDKLYESGGQCLTPVLAAPRVPSSILR